MKFINSPLSKSVSRGYNLSKANKYYSVVQQGEHQPHKLEVVGSKPTRITFCFRACLSLFVIWFIRIKYEAPQKTL